MAQKGSERAPKRSKMAPKDFSGLKWPQTAPNYTKTAQKAILSPYNPTPWLCQTFPHMDTLLEPFGDLLQHLSTLREPFLFQKVTKRPWKGKKKVLQAFFGPSKAPIVSYSRPKKVKIGQNGSKRCPNGSKYSQNGPKWWQHRLKRRQRGQNTVKVGSQGS